VRGDLFEDLEGVERRDRLAARRTRIGFQCPAEAAVGVAIAGEHGQRGLRVAVADGELHPAAVEQAGVRGDEVEDPVEVDHSQSLGISRFE
jgi:hypothetical protein